MQSDMPRNRRQHEKGARERDGDCSVLGHGSPGTLVHMKEGSCGAYDQKCLIRSASAYGPADPRLSNEGVSFWWTTGKTMEMELHWMEETWAADLLRF